MGQTDERDKKKKRGGENRENPWNEERINNGVKMTLQDCRDRRSVIIVCQG